MLVTFKPKLVAFCSDVREFENMGYSIPIELRNTAMHAIRFMGHARKLQQIANFHNTIGDRMVACLRPIMLKNALELSKLVHSESVAWNDEDSVDRYVSTLQFAVNNLSRDNTVLTEYHEKTKAIVRNQSYFKMASIILSFVSLQDYQAIEHGPVAPRRCMEGGDAQFAEYRRSFGNQRLFQFECIQNTLGSSIVQNIGIPISIGLAGYQSETARYLY